MGVDTVPTFATLEKIGLRRAQKIPSAGGETVLASWAMPFGRLLPGARGLLR
jgi:hypothetical protein